MVQIGFKNDRGIKRANNEDACFVIPSENIYIIADGVGGNNAGEIASRTAVAMMAGYVRDNPVPDGDAEEDVRRYFTECIYRINKEIYSISRNSEDNKGMATTIVAVYIDGGSAYIVNVGDSRAYLLREGAMHQITEDHTYVNELLKSGAITEEEVKHHPNKNIITRAIGGDVIVEPDIFRIGIK